MITYNKFLENISILHSKGWKPNKAKIDNINETIEHLEYQISEGNMNPDTLIEYLKIEMNVANSYCYYIQTSVKTLYERYEKLNTFDFQEIYDVLFCIGDLTSKISSNEAISMLFFFQPERSTSRIVESLILLSKLPFENDKVRKEFNITVKYYQRRGHNPQDLQPVPLENPGSCYIATMVYGDFNHPQVMYLRSYRDNTLLNCAFGRQFVKFYYLTAPLLVFLLKKHKRINRYLEIILNKLIEKLKKYK